jgi:hypothetical protein
MVVPFLTIPFLAIRSEVCYFNTCSVTALNTREGVARKSMNTKASYIGQKSGSFLRQIFLKSFFSLHNVIPSIAVGFKFQDLSRPPHINKIFCPVSINSLYRDRAFESLCAHFFVAFGKLSSLNRFAFRRWLVVKVA